MKMKELKNFYNNSLNYDNIDFSDYFRTLSFEGKRQGIIGEEAFNVIKRQMGDLLSDTILAFTGYESTSVMKETANDIFVSILYCLDMALFTFSSHEEALKFISEYDVVDIYNKGQKVIKQCVFECISLLVKLKGDRISFPDKSYNAVLDGEVLTYLKKYDSRYFAHGTKRVFAYRSVNGCGGYRGVLHLKRYLENLIFENKYIGKYDEETIQNICYGYCENNGLAYNDIGKNIYSIVLMNEVFCRLAGKEGVEITREDAIKVSKDLKKLNENEQRKIICQTVESISGDSYCYVSAIKLAGHVVNAVNNNELNKVIYIGELK